MTTDPRYPIGHFERVLPATAEQRAALIQQIADAPVNLRAAVAGLNDAQLDTSYRPGGWTVRQVCHHLPDSHLNSYIRFRLALTEDLPTIKPYNETLWAELSDAKHAPIDISLRLLESLHQRWVLLLRSMSPADFQRKLNHPETGENVLDFYLVLYAWHGRHHISQITSFRERMKW